MKTIDIATIPIGNIGNDKLFEKRLIEMFQKLELLTGLKFDEDFELIKGHLLEFRKDWTLVKVYKAFEYNHSVYTDSTNRVQYFGSKCTVLIIQDVLKSYQLAMNRRSKSTLSTNFNLTDKEKKKLTEQNRLKNIAACEQVFSEYQTKKDSRFLGGYYDTLVKEFGMPDTYLDHVKNAEAELKAKYEAEIAEAKKHNRRAEVISLERAMANLGDSLSAKTRAKGNVVKAYFDLLIMEGKELDVV